MVVVVELAHSSWDHFLHLCNSMVGHLQRGKMVDGSVVEEDE